MTLLTGADSDEVLPIPVDALLRAIMSISDDLDLHRVLSRIVEAACELTGARYGALGILGSDGDLAEFITTGIGEDERAAIGAPPRGHGILGVLIKDARSLRLEDLNLHPDAVGMPPNHPPMHSFLGVPVRVRGTVFGNLYLTDKAGAGSFTADDEILVQSLANAAGLVIENARAYGLSERRRRWLESSAQLSDALVPPIDIDEEALTEIAVRARLVSRAAAAFVIAFPAGEHPVIVAFDGDEGADLRSLLRHVLAEVPAPQQLSGAVDVRLGDGFGVGAIARVVPLHARLGDPGALVVVLDSPEAREHESELLVGFCDQAGLALDRAQAVSDRQELALVSERARIARDLHDVVIQRLFAAGLRLQSLRVADGAEPNVEELVDDLDRIIQSIRNTIFGLQREPA